MLKGKSLTHSKVMKKTGEKGTQDPEARTGLKMEKGNRRVRGWVAFATISWELDPVFCGRHEVSA